MKDHNTSQLICFHRLHLCVMWWSPAGVGMSTLMSVTHAPCTRERGPRGLARMSFPLKTLYHWKERRCISWIKGGCRGKNQENGQPMVYRASSVSSLRRGDIVTAFADAGAADGRDLSDLDDTDDDNDNGEDADADADAVDACVPYLRWVSATYCVAMIEPRLWPSRMKEASPPTSSSSSWSAASITAKTLAWNCSSEK